MRTLLTLSMVLLLGLGFSVPAEANTGPENRRAEIKRMIISEAQKTTVPVSLALAVAKVESDFNARALSSAGARGVMQIMPATARSEFGVSADRLWGARLNVRLGLTYLERLRQQYGGKWELALSHYNGGTLKGRGAKAKPHSYTRGYVAKVKKWARVYQEQNEIWADATEDVQPETAPEIEPVNFAIAEPEAEPTDWARGEPDAPLPYEDLYEQVGYEQVGTQAHQQSDWAEPEPEVSLDRWDEGDRWDDWSDEPDLSEDEAIEARAQWEGRSSPDWDEVEPQRERFEPAWHRRPPPPPRHRMHRGHRPPPHMARGHRSGRWR